MITDQSKMKLRMMFKTLYILGAFLLLNDFSASAQIIYTKANRPSAPAIAELPLMDSLSQYGITWKFNKKVHVGKFITGSYYVIGPVTVTSITPAPEGGCNGSMLNGPAKYQSGYDSRSIGYSASTTTKAPVN